MPRIRLGVDGFLKSSCALSELDMASPGFSVSPENTTITLGRGRARRSRTNLLTREAEGSELEMENEGPWRSLGGGSSDPFGCMQAPVGQRPPARGKGKFSLWK